MINCKEATRRISQQEEGKLSLKKRWQLWQHLAICTMCRMFNKQNKVFIKSVPHMDEYIDASLSQLEKDAIVAALETS